MILEIAIGVVLGIVLLSVLPQLIEWSVIGAIAVVCVAVIVGVGYLSWSFLTDPLRSEDRVAVLIFLSVVAFTVGGGYLTSIALSRALNIIFNFSEGLVFWFGSMASIAMLYFGIFEMQSDISIIVCGSTLLFLTLIPVIKKKLKAIAWSAKSSSESDGAS